MPLCHRRGVRDLPVEGMRAVSIATRVKIEPRWMVDDRGHSTDVQGVEGALAFLRGTLSIKFE
eukprot:119322-Prorocentrum_lima.AAC.1